MPLVIALTSLLSLVLASAPAPSPSDLSRLLAEKNLGLAALEEGNLAEAKKRFETVRRLAPAEPLGWADGAVAAMRGKQLPEAKKLLAEALRLAPADARLLSLSGTLSELEGDRGVALDAFGRAAAANPKDVASRWAAARLAAGEPGNRPRAI